MIQGGTWYCQDEKNILSNNESKQHAGKVA
jgi:hypothetical protein